MSDMKKWDMAINSKLVDFAPITFTVMAPTAKDAEKLVQRALLTARVNAEPSASPQAAENIPRLQLRARV